jgi:hypothetical protein
MKWVTPLLLVGTPEDAAWRGEVFTADPADAIEEMNEDRTLIVASPEIAAEVIRHFGASEDWITRHVLTPWGPGHIDSAP